LARKGELTYGFLYERRRQYKKEERERDGIQSISIRRGRIYVVQPGFGDPESVVVREKTNVCGKGGEKWRVDGMKGEGFLAKQIRWFRARRRGDELYPAKSREATR